MNPDKRVIGFLLFAILMIPSTSIAGTVTVKATSGKQRCIRVSLQENPSRHVKEDVKN